jgi:excisionase family DNA binding protein
MMKLERNRKLRKDVELPIEDSELMTVSEVARGLRVDNTTVRRWAKQGVLEVVILPHLNERQGYRIKHSTYERLLNSPAVPPTGE